MSESGNEGNNPSDKKRGFFARFKKDAATEGSASQHDISHTPTQIEPTAVVTHSASPELPVSPAAHDEAGDESRFSKFRRAFTWGQDDKQDAKTVEAPLTPRADSAAPPAEESPQNFAPTFQPESPAVEEAKPSFFEPPAAIAPEPPPAVSVPAAVAPAAPVATAAPVAVVVPPEPRMATPPPVAVDVRPAAMAVPSPVPLAEHPPRDDRFGKIKRALERTRKGLGRVFLGKKQIDDDLLESLETHLLTADLGIEVTAEVIKALTDRVNRKELNNVDALHTALRGLLIEILKPCEIPLNIDVRAPFVLMVVGVNGVGKTTTIGKLARHYLKQSKSVMLAAGDTFRAAAVEQLQIWGERNQVPVVAQHTGADSASVIYDAFESARAKHTRLLIADTAGRLHTKSNLMDELKKIKRVLGKLDDKAPHEVLLVLDAGTGQNAVNQLQQFHEAVGITGIVLTKLDGTAKGGVIFALCRRFGIPVRFIGVGEGVDDLQPFRAEDFVDALLATDGQHDQA